MRELAAAIYSKEPNELSQEEIKKVDLAFFELDIDTRSVVFSRFGLGRYSATYEQIAFTFGMPLEKVKQIARKAIIRIQKKVKRG